MNKPETLRFEYEKLFNKDGELRGYEVSCRFQGYPNNCPITGMFSRLPDYGMPAFMTREGFGAFQKAVNEYNTQFCKQPEVDTSVLDGFKVWINNPSKFKTVLSVALFQSDCWSEFVSMINEYKQTLTEEYFEEKK